MPELKTKIKRRILEFGWLVFFSLFTPFVFAASPFIGTLTPSSGQSQAEQMVTFTARYYDADGWTNLKEAYLLVSTSPTNFSNSAYLYYDQNTNKVYLRNDTNTKWLGGYSPGLDYTVENSQVKLMIKYTAVFGSGDTLVINWSVVFKNTFTGKKLIYLYVKDDTGGSFGWIRKGTWTIYQSLSISVNPKEWNIELLPVGGSITMNPDDKITVTNNGTASETFELKLINPSGWTASTTPGQERYVLSGIFCNLYDLPQSNIFSSDDVITTASQKATSTVFAYSQSTANGVAVPSGSSRSLYLQFKSPTATNKTTQQEISVIVSCQTP